MTWRSVNGWAALRALRGQVEGLSQYILSVGPLTLAASDTVVPVSGSVDAIVDSDSELWILGADLHGGEPDADSGQLGYSAEAWPDWWDATAVVSLDSGSGVRLVDTPVHVGSIFGGPRGQAVAGLSYWRDVNYWNRHELAAPWILPPGTNVRVAVSHRFNLEQEARFSFHGFKRALDSPPVPVDFFLTPDLVGALRRVYGDRRTRVEPFFYALNFDEDTGRTVQGIEQRTVTMADSDFFVTELHGYLLDPAQTAFFPTSGFDFMPRVDSRLVVDDGRIRLDQRPVPFTNRFGTGRDPAFLPEPLYLPAGSSLTCILSFLESQADDRPLRAYVTAHGVRVFS